jgi:hypothetical protein
LADVFHSIRGREAYRCRKCRHRFYGAKPTGQGAPGSHRSSHFDSRSLWRGGTQQRRRLFRKLLFFAVFAVAFAIFWMVLRFISTDRMPSEDYFPTGSASVSSTLQNC